MKKKDIFLSEIVREIEGVGIKYGRILAERAGIKTLEDIRCTGTEDISRLTGISPNLVSRWKSVALLRMVVGIDRQVAEVLIKMGICNLWSLRNANPKEILKAIDSARNPKNKYNIIPDTYKKVITLERVLMWQRSVNIPHIMSNDFNAPNGFTGDHYVNIWIEREYETKFSTLGSLFIGGRHFYTLEPPDRNNAATSNYLTAGRIYPGSYSSFVRTDGSRGWRIELRNVPGRSEIQIHAGNFYKDTVGCILPGRSKGIDNEGKDCVIDSIDALKDIRAVAESAGSNPDITVSIYGIPQKIKEDTSSTPSSDTQSSSSSGGW